MRHNCPDYPPCPSCIDWALQPEPEICPYCGEQVPSEKGIYCCIEYMEDVMMTDQDRARESAAAIRHDLGVLTGLTNQHLEWRLDRQIIQIDKALRDIETHLKPDFCPGFNGRCGEHRQAHSIYCPECEELYLETRAQREPEPKGGAL